MPSLGFNPSKFLFLCLAVLLQNILSLSKSRGSSFVLLFSPTDSPGHSYWCPATADEPALLSTAHTSSLGGPTSSL